MTTVTREIPTRCVMTPSVRRPRISVIIAAMRKPGTLTNVRSDSARPIGATALILLALAAAAVLHAQSRATAGAAGRVIDGLTNQPIAGAFVTIGPTARTAGQPTIVADDQGRFSFRDLPAGTYELAASARGYLAGDGHTWNGALALPTSQVELKEAEQRSEITIRLWPPARISGTIRDDLGDPIEGVQLGILRVEYVAGHRRLRVVGGTISDDRGWYRSVRLPPGSYTVGALMRRMTIPVSFRESLDRLMVAPAAEQSGLERSIRSSGAMADFRAAGYRVGAFIVEPGMGGASLGPAPSSDGTLLAASTLFYPGVASPMQAQAVTVGPGDDRRGVDLHVRLTKSNRVTGRVVGPDGPIPNIGVSLLPEGFEALSSETSFEQAVTISNESGEFTFLAVPDGSYVARAYVIPPPAMPDGKLIVAVGDDPTLSGSLAIVVRERDVSDVHLMLRKGPSVLGRLVFEGSRQIPNAQQLAQGNIRFELANGRAPSSPPMPPIRSAVDANAAFRSLGLPSGRYVIRVSGFPGWTLESAVLNGRDISDVALDTETTTGDFTGVVVTLTDTPATLSGTVRTSAGAAAADATVLVFSANAVDWTDRGATPRRVVRTSSSRDGSFSMVGLPPGEYFAVASSDGLPDNWSMPEFLKAASSAASKVTVDRRATRFTTLTAVTLPRGGSR